MNQSSSHDTNVNINDEKEGVPSQQQDEKQTQEGPYQSTNQSQKANDESLEDDARFVCNICLDPGIHVTCHFVCKSTPYLDMFL